MKTNLILFFLLLFCFQKGYSQGDSNLVQAAVDVFLAIPDLSKIDLSSEQKKINLNNDVKDLKQQLNLSNKQTRLLKKLMGIRLEKESAIFADQNIKPEDKSKLFQEATNTMQQNIIKILEAEQIVKYNKIKSNY